MSSHAADEAGMGRGSAISIAVICVGAEILTLGFAIYLFPKFLEVHAELRQELPVLTKLALSYGPSAALIIFSIIMVPLAALCRGWLRTIALIVAFSLPILHMLVIVVSTYLPLLEMGKTIGGG